MDKPDNDHSESHSLSALTIAEDFAIIAKTSGLGGENVQILKEAPEFYIQKCKYCGAVLKYSESDITSNGGSGVCHCVLNTPTEF